MKRGIFVLYCPKGLKLPKMYRYRSWVQKTLMAEPSYQIQNFKDQGEGNQFLLQKKREYKNTVNAATVGLLKANLQETVFPNQHSVFADKGQVQSFKLIDQKIRQDREAVINQIFCSFGLSQSPTFRSQPFPTSPSLQYEGFFDGASKGNPGRASAGFLIRYQHSRLLAKTEALGTLTCNQAEMMSMGLLMAHAYCNDVQKLIVFGDSKISIQFMKGKMTAWNERLINLVKCNEIISNKFKFIKFNHVRRQFNEEADRLAGMAFLSKTKRL